MKITEARVDSFTLRDLFAAAALAGIFNHGGADGCGPEEIASDCYQHADAMLKARGDSE